MGKKAVKLYLRAVSLAATIVVAVLTYMALTGGDDVPAKSIFHAMLTVTLPLWLVANVLLAIWWVIRLKWYVIIPVATLGCCWGYVGTMYRWGNGDEDKGVEMLKVASYNVRRFNKDASGITASEIKQKMLREGADVLCIQEYNGTLADKSLTVPGLFKPEYPYCTRHKGDVVILSRFPIKAEGAHQWEDTNSSFQWADIDVGGGQVVRFYNMHLQSTSINANLKKAGDNQDMQNSAIYDLVAEGYAWGLNLRSGQAIDVANHKRECKHPIILCADLNDVPYSFAYHTVKGNLEDGFVTAGDGLGTTYRGGKGMVRIDYIMHSTSLEGVQYYSRDWEYSDHKPIFMGLARQSLNENN